MDVFQVEDVSAETITALLAQAAETWPWLYAERPETTELLWLAESQADWQQWPYARAFGPESELNWQRQEDGRYTLRLLTDAPPPVLTGLDWGAAAVWQPFGSEQSTWLHGRLDEDRSEVQGELTWSEARIPRWLAYPLGAETAPPERVVLQVQTYAQGGIVGLTRLLAVQAAPAD